MKYFWIWLICSSVLLAIFRSAKAPICVLKTDKDKKRCGDICCCECERYEHCMYRCELNYINCGYARRGK